MKKGVFMLGEVTMIIEEEEMRRAAQIYVDTVFKVDVEVASVHQMRTDGKPKKKFEIKLKAKGSKKEAPRRTIRKKKISEPVSLGETKEGEYEVAIQEETPMGQRLKTLEEIRAGNNTDAQS